MSPGTAKKGRGFQTESGDPSPPHVPLVSSCKFVGPAKSPSREQGRPCFKGGSRGGSGAPLEEHVGGRAGGVLSSHFLQASEEPTGPTWSPASAEPCPGKGSGDSAWPVQGARPCRGAVRADAKRPAGSRVRGVARPRHSAAPGGAALWPGPEPATAACAPHGWALDTAPSAKRGEGAPHPGAGSFSFCSAVRGGFGFTHRSPGCCQLLPTVSV